MTSPDTSTFGASVEEVPFDVVRADTGSAPFVFPSFATSSTFTSFVTGESREGRADGGGDVTLTKELFVEPRRAASANRSLRVFLRTGPVEAGGGDETSGREVTDEGRWGGDETGVEGAEGGMGTEVGGIVIVGTDEIGGSDDCDVMIGTGSGREIEGGAADSAAGGGREACSKSGLTSTKFGSLCTADGERISTEWESTVASGVGGSMSSVASGAGIESS